MQPDECEAPVTSLWLLTSCYQFLACYPEWGLGSFFFFFLKGNWFLKLTPGMVYLGRNWCWHLLDWPSESCPDMKQVLTAHFGQQSRRALELEAFSSSLLCCRYSCLGPLSAFILPSLVCICTFTSWFLCVDEFCSISSTFMVADLHLTYLLGLLFMEKTSFQNPNSGIN